MSISDTLLQVTTLIVSEEKTSLTQTAAELGVIGGKSKLLFTTSLLHTYSNPELATVESPACGTYDCRSR